MRNRRTKNNNDKLILLQGAGLILFLVNSYMFTIKEGAPVTQMLAGLGAILSITLMLERKL